MRPAPKRVGAYAAAPSSTERHQTQLGLRIAPAVDACRSLHLAHSRVHGACRANRRGSSAGPVPPHPTTAQSRVILANDLDVDAVVPEPIHEPVQLLAVSSVGDQHGLPPTV